MPLYTTVDVQGLEVPAMAYATNVSEGGVAIKVIDAPADFLAPRSRAVIGFRLPGGTDRLTLASTVMWSEAASVGFTGRVACAVGLSFDAGQEREREALRAFVRNFPHRVGLLGEGDPAALQAALGEHYSVEHWSYTRTCHTALASGQVALVVVSAPELERGLALLGDVLAAPPAPWQPPIIYCGRGDESVLEQRVLRHGRVLVLDLHPGRLVLRSAAQRAIESQWVTAENERLTAELEGALGQLERENRALRARVLGPVRPEGIIGDSEPMRKLFSQLERVAPLTTTVTVLGESGTGKELVARALHALSPRAKRPFVAQNCASLPEGLLDVELFGHARGAFTGAVGERAGLFESADGGTVFLDEVGEMPPAMQAKLLRVLQEGELRRLGSNRTVKLDVRLICATHRNLEAMAREGRFREDLYYRLHAFLLRLPPLRERMTDIPALAVHFLDGFARQHGRPSPGLSDGALRVLLGHDWPGNVRELQHVMERLVVLCEPGRVVDAALAAEALGLTVTEDLSEPAGSLDEALERHERAMILAELKRAGGVLAQAAKRLGMNRSTLSRRCKRLGIGGSAVSDLSPSHSQSPSAPPSPEETEAPVPEHATVRLVSGGR